MIIQILLSAGLFAVFAYSLIAGVAGRLLRLVTMLTVIVGLFFVWFPEKATGVANFVGVGRGTDLVLYCWILVSIILIVNLHIKLRHYESRFTELVRNIALRYCTPPGANVEMDSTPKRYHGASDWAKRL
jgi:hypothetical protein